MNRIKRIFTVICILLSFGSSMAQDSLNISMLGSLYNNWDLSADLFIVDTLVFIATTGSGLRILDIRNPGSLNELGFCYTPSNAYDVAVAGEYAYIADGSEGLCVVNVSDLENPVVVGSFDEPSGLKVWQFMEGMLT